MTEIDRLLFLYLNGQIEDEIFVDYIRLHPNDLYTLSISGTTFFYRLMKYAIELRKRERGLKLLRLMIDNKVNIDFQSSRGDTLLMDAIHYEWIEMVKMLLEGGADIYIKNKYGYDALKYCAVMVFANHNKKVKITDMILEIYTNDITKKVRNDMLKELTAMLCLDNCEISTEMKCEIIEKI